MGASLGLRKVYPTIFALIVMAFAITAQASTYFGQNSSVEQNQDSSGTASQPNDGVKSAHQGVVVQAMRFPGVQSEREQKQLLAVLPLQAGKPFDRDLLRRSIKVLDATGRFADVRAEAEPTADGGVVISFVTVPNYFIGEITVDGNSNRPSASQIVNAAKLQLGDLFSSEKLNQAVINIEQLMATNGYYRLTITKETREHPETQQVGIVFHISLGAQAHVGQVNITGNQNYSQQRFLDIAKMHPGDLVSVQRTSTALDRLRKQYQRQQRWLAQVTLAQHSYRPAANVVDYTFQIDPGPRVEIVAEGYRIPKKILKREVPVYQENALDDDLLNEGRHNLLNYMQSRGHFDAKVAMRRESNSTANALRVIYSIDPGSRHKVVKVVITGNKYFSEDLLRTRMQVQTSSRLFAQGRFNQAILNDDISGLEGLYRANGFQSVKITSNVEDDYRGQENQFAITLHVNEGPQTLVNALTISGNSVVPETQLRANINTAEGQLFSEFNIAQDRETILNYYFNRGFPNATFDATAKPTPGKQNRMDVIFTVHEGEQVFVEQVLVSGMNFTRPFVIQRELQMSPGDPVSQIDMLKTQQRLYDLGIFSQVDTAIQNPAGIEREKKVLVQVQEAKRYTFNYGLGFEFQTGQPGVNGHVPQGKAGVSPLVSLAITRLNFRGRNHTVTFSTHLGQLQQRGLVGYEAPRWFNSPNWKLSITSFYDNTLDVSTFTSQRLETSIQAEQIASKIVTMDYRFNYRRVRASNVAISPGEIPLLSLPVRVGEPGFSYIRNTRDSDLESTKGTYTVFDGGVASSYFGSEADFSRVLVQNSTYHTIGKKRPNGKRLILARSTRIGLENPFRDTVNVSPGEAPPAERALIPLPERFFSGGGNSHRGFGLNQAGPRDPVTGFPLGGSALFVNNLELRFPAATLPFFQDNLSFAIFHDVGNVFSKGSDMLPSLLRWHQKNPELCLQQSTASQCNYNYLSHAIGVGVRYRTPIGPVRFDFGYNLNPPAFPGQKTISSTPVVTVFDPQHTHRLNVYFSIGQTF
ncbi:MAG: outer membrane protein insertion porin family [Acidobacteriaceae bacterium]|jgi:outer membrane protein insertion porin family